MKHGETLPCGHTVDLQGVNRTRAGASDTCIRVALHAGTYAALFTLFAAWGFGL